MFWYWICIGFMWQRSFTWTPVSCWFFNSLGICLGSWWKWPVLWWVPWVPWQVQIWTFCFALIEIKIQVIQILVVATQKYFNFQPCLGKIPILMIIFFRWIETTTLKWYSKVFWRVVVNFSNTLFACWISVIFLVFMNTIFPVVFVVKGAKGGSREQSDGGQRNFDSNPTSWKNVHFFSPSSQRRCTTCHYYPPGNLT